MASRILIQAEARMEAAARKKAELDAKMAARHKEAQPRLSDERFIVCC